MFFGRKPPKYVLLILHCGDAKVRPVVEAQCGMAVKVYDKVETSYAVLRLDGTAVGYSGVANWMPYSGFTDDELELYEDCFRFSSVDEQETKSSGAISKSDLGTIPMNNWCKG